MLECNENLSGEMEGERADVKAHANNSHNSVKRLQEDTNKHSMKQVTICCMNMIMN